jgi:CBS domain containing-hemolysin-like protein
MEKNISSVPSNYRIKRDETWLRSRLSKKLYDATKVSTFVLSVFASWSVVMLTVLVYTAYEAYNHTVNSYIGIMILSLAILFITVLLFVVCQNIVYKYSSSFRQEKVKLLTAESIRLKRILLLYTGSEKIDNFRVVKDRLREVQKILKKFKSEIEIDLSEFEDEPQALHNVNAEAMKDPHFRRMLLEK